MGGYFLDYSALDKYEYKRPSYELNDRSYPVDPAYAEQARFVYNEETGTYCSKAGAKNEISLLFAGDLLCQENMLKHYRTENGFDFSACFEYIRPLLRTADFAAGNLETPVSHTAPYRGEIITHEGPFYCNAPLQYLEAVSYAGFDMLYTANNHTIDAGARGLIETIENTRKFGMIQTGTFTEKCDKYVIVDICGFRVGFTSFGLHYNSMDFNMTEDGKDTLLNIYSPENMKRIYDEMKAKGAEYVVCFPHWGKEYTDVLIEKQRSAAKVLAEIGYDLIAGSHAHVIQEATEIAGKPVLYSMGHLISHMNVKAADKEASALTMLYSLKLKRQDGAVVPEVGVIPCKIMRNVNGIPFAVIPVTNSLDYGVMLKTKMATVPSDVAQRLKSNVLPIVTNYPVSPEEAAAFCDAQAALPGKLSALTPEESASSKSAETAADVVEDRGGVYVLYKKHAELVRFQPPAGSSTFSPPSMVQDKPVTVYTNYSRGNTNTKLIYLPASVKIIGAGMFRDFTALESMRAFNGLKTICSGAFENCTAMTGLIFPATLETIEDNAFKGCSKLMSVKLPESVTFISESAFDGCDKLTIYCEEGTYADSYAKKMQIPVKYMPQPKKADVVAEKPEAESKPKKRALEPFAGAATVLENSAELDQIRKTLPTVKMGPMNGPDDKHPDSIIATCRILNNPLPDDAKCGHQPSYYIHPKNFDGKRSTITKLLGDRMPKMKKELFEKAYRQFRQKYQTQECLDRNAVDFTVYFCDWLLFARKYGFSHDDYFDFEFYNKEPAVRETFLDEKLRLHIYKVCADKEYRGLFKNKPTFNEKFAEFIHRDWVDATTCTFEEFKAFAEKHDRFFVKPLGRCGGRGAHIMETGSDTMENLFHQCQLEGVLCEEIIVQHDSLASFNASTLNTVRVLTVLDGDNVPHVLLGVARFGRSGNVVDNFHGGGVGAIVDVDTGIVISEAINQSHIRRPIHPDSKLPINGFKYPEWEKIKETAKRAALVVPQIRNIGWDFAVNKNGDVEIVEGNSRSGFDILQSPDQIGRKFLYDPYLAELEKLAGVEPLVREPVKIPAELLNTEKPKAPKAPKLVLEPKQKDAPKKSFFERLFKR